MRLFEMVDLSDMPGGMGALEADALAMAAGRKAPGLDHRNLVRHVGMRRIVGDGVDAGLRHDLSGLEFLRHGWPPVQIYRRFMKRSSTLPRSCRVRPRPRETVLLDKAGERAWPAGAAPPTHISGRVGHVDADRDLQRQRHQQAACQSARVAGRGHAGYRLSPGAKGAR